METRKTADLGALEIPRGWQAAAHTLDSLLGDSAQPSPPAIFLHAPSSAKCVGEIVRALVPREGLRVVTVSALVSCTPRLLFAHVLRQLGVHSACTDLCDFFAQLRQAKGKIVLLVEDAERMRDLWPEHIWEMIPLLAEYTGTQGRIVVLFLSCLPWASFRTNSGRTVSASPVLLHFGRLAPSDIIALLEQDRDICFEASYKALPSMEGESALDARALRHLHKSFVALFYDSVKGMLHDANDIRSVAAAVWRVLMLRVRRTGTHNITALMPYISELVRDAIKRLVPRTIGPAAWAAEREAPCAIEEIPQQNWPTRTGFTAMQAFLLIAAFLASYNPTKTDAAIFVRELGNSRKRRRRTKKQGAADAALDEIEGAKDAWNRPQYWGPRTFAVERLFAIYHALLADFQQDLNEDGLLVSNERAQRTSDNKVELHLEHVAGEFWSRSAAAMGQINELVTKKLLVRMSPAGKLGTIQYRVNVPYAFVRALAHSVGFPLDTRLHDWHA
ncbi:hypothetical protein MVES1_002282 [Malassezia vespertilionis]|uniref:uncharacterized protein n=1 Tax=Malassezia vespertilionis TaxID=2020962 RepID=UPI0024B0D957|nr:uncharacterized protein MVES1_002282 [Malassezia vespertilionis]WFD06927.1 hypothetical protein MVES1_002282 [Malassezia vespertilionis]